MNKYKFYLVGFFLVALTADLFFNSRIFNNVYIGLTGLWIINIFNFKMKPRLTLIMAAILYSIAFIFQFTEKIVVVEKSTSWFFIFLVIFLLQMLLSDVNKNEKPRN